MRIGVDFNDFIHEQSVRHTIEHLSKIKKEKTAHTSLPVSSNLCQLSTAVNRAPVVDFPLLKPTDYWKLENTHADVIENIFACVSLGACLQPEEVILGSNLMDQTSFHVLELDSLVPVSFWLVVYQV